MKINRTYMIALGILAVAASIGIVKLVFAQPKTLTIYSGRNERLIGPLIEKAKQDLGMNIQVRYGDTAELAIAILEEGKNSPADIYFGQDAGALGALAKAGRTEAIPANLLQKVDGKFRDRNGKWLGISGRARVLDYNTNAVASNELPSSVWQLTQPKWRGKVGWAPTNGSFQSFVTAMRLTAGDAKTLEWLKAMKANGTKVFANNTSIVEALGRGEIHLGLVNNYYLYRFIGQNPNFPVKHHYMPGDVGSMVNVAGVAIVDTTDQKADAQKFIEYLLSNQSQNYFAQETNEYPLVSGIAPPQGQITIAQINPPNIDLSNLSDLEGTLALLQQAGLL